MIQKYGMKREFVSGLMSMNHSGLNIFEYCFAFQDGAYDDKRSKDLNHSLVNLVFVFVFFSVCCLYFVSMTFSPFCLDDDENGIKSYHFNQPLLFVKLLNVYLHGYFNTQ